MNTISFISCATGRWCWRWSWTVMDAGWMSDFGDETSPLPDTTTTATTTNTTSTAVALAGIDGWKGPEIQDPHIFPHDGTHNSSHHSIPLGLSFVRPCHPPLQGSAIMFWVASINDHMFILDRFMIFWLKCLSQFCWWDKFKWKQRILAQRWKK